MNDDVISENIARTSGMSAQRNNILAAKIVADVVKTTLGPKGMDKMLVDSAGGITVTNDGVTILEEMEIDHPAARMLVDIAKTQEFEVGDGTTTAVLLAGSFLENAEKLLDRKIHPTVIVKGYRTATAEAMRILPELSVNVDSKETLKKIAMTAMTGKSAEGDREKLAEIVVESVDAISQGNEISLNDIKIESISGGNVSDSELIRGIAFSKERVNSEMPKKIENAKILLCDFPIELRTTEAEARISVSTPEQLENFIQREEDYLKKMTRQIIDSGANVIFCQKGIDDVAQYYLAQAGIFACRRVLKSDMEKISRATSGKIVSSLDEVSEGNFGRAEIVEEYFVGNEPMVFIRGCKNPRAVTLLLRGGTEHVVREIERAVRDSLGDVVSAFKSGKIVAGGGATEVELAKRLRNFARTVGGKEQLAIEMFSDSLESVPETLAENAGLDPIDVLTELRKRHESGSMDGLNLFNNSIGNTLREGIIEPLKVKSQAISSASEVAQIILRIDDVLISSGKKVGSNNYEGLD